MNNKKLRQEATKEDVAKMTMQFMKTQGVNVEQFQKSTTENLGKDTTELVKDGKNRIELSKNTMNSVLSLAVQEDPKTGDGILIFPDGFVESMGWQVDDELEWKLEGVSAVITNRSWLSRQKK